MKTYEIELTFLEAMLGTVPKNKEIYDTYIRSKAPSNDDTEDELDSVEDIEERNWTGFHMEDDKPFIYNYMMKGFFKAACGALRRVPGTGSNKLTAFKKVIDGLVFIQPRKIFIDFNCGEMDVLERPLRASTPKGERVTLTRSDTVPVGSTVKLQVNILGGVSKKLLTEWLDYGQFSGLGQWRNAEYGRFSYKMA